MIKDVSLVITSNTSEVKKSSKNILKVGYRVLHTPYIYIYLKFPP